MGYLESVENGCNRKESTLMDFDIHILDVLTEMEIERMKIEQYWESFITIADNEVETFNLLLNPLGIKVTATWDENEVMEWIEFNFKPLDGSSAFNFCFMDVRNYGNEYFTFNRSSAKADLGVLTNTLKEKFYSQMTKEVYEGIFRVHIKHTYRELI